MSKTFSFTSYEFKERDNQDCSKIDTKGVKIISGYNGDYEYDLPDFITTRAYDEYIRYLYLDRPSWDIMSGDVDKKFLEEVIECAKFFSCDRLAVMAENYLKKSENESFVPLELPETFQRMNYKWAFYNLRDGIYDLSDIVVNCTGGDSPGKVKAHSLILMCNSGYLKRLIENLPTGAPREIELKIVSKPEFMAILYYIYTMEFKIEVDNLISTWIASNYLLIPSLQLEVETRISDEINQENVKDIRKIAKRMNSSIILDRCKEIDADEE